MSDYKNVLKKCADMGIDLWTENGKLKYKASTNTLSQDILRELKKYKEQIRIVNEVLHSRNCCPELHKLVKGVMIESYLLEGRQEISDHMTPGCSITDPCLGWEDTERLLYDIAEKC